ncbi:hypothetical protein [Staphylococcus saprophyticus]|uniref:hypothetical protein n=1 Tax=Staphylococcus TaxID=1279 RepID=UPI0022EA6594|nr:hypothetical protein [Staphylococcus saprophyticus]MDW4397451.1 hypothetical protein [Staphylococcus saprophyticus]
MVAKERGSITLNKKEAVVFANKKFKPFHNRIQQSKNKSNPFAKLNQNGKN